MEVRTAMRILVSGYGTGSRNGDQARQYKTLRIDGGDASKSARIVQGGVVSGSRRQISLNISGTTRKVGDSLDNDVEILLYDLNQAEIAALIGKLIELSDGLGAERHGRRYGRRAQERARLSKAVMKSLCGNISVRSHVAILKEFMAGCEGAIEYWGAMLEALSQSERERQSKPENLDDSYEAVISSYLRALPHLRAAQKILNREVEKTPGNVVQFTATDEESTSP